MYQLHFDVLDKVNQEVVYYMIEYYIVQLLSYLVEFSLYKIIVFTSLRGSKSLLTPMPFAHNISDF